MSEPQMLFDKPSFQSLFLEVKCGSRSISTASGFIVRRPDGSPLLITNWHVLAGRNHETREPLDKKYAAIPDSINVEHNTKGSLGSWTIKTEPLYGEDDKPAWLEHPEYGSKVDVVGLPLRDIANIDLFEYSHSGPSGYDVGKLPAPLAWGASDFVNVIGFPFGWTGGGSLGIWVQGAVATEPDIDFRGLPRFLIDSRTCEGQSGSPVVIYKRSGWVTTTLHPYMIRNPITLLLGVYSGRLSKDSDLGTVWKTSIVAAIAENGIRGQTPTM